jgi:hypothetical protein
MIEQLNATSLEPGVSRQCQANRHCAMEGPSFTVPVVSIGRPDLRLTIGCEVCGIFACGGCAKRDALRLRLGDTQVFAWLHACPLCGCVLGDPQPGQAVLHSAHFGSLAVLDTSVTPWQLENERTLDHVRDALAHHDAKALRLLWVFNLQSSVPGVIRLSEMAVEESPGEGVAWLYVALLCAKAGYPFASRHALKELAALINDADMDQRPGLASIRQLDLTVNDCSLDSSRIEDLAKRLADCDEQLAHRARELFNPDLALYHSFVRSYFDGNVSPTEAVKEFFPAGTPTTPAISDFLTAQSFEESIDLAEVTAERERFITVLTSVVADDEVTDLVAQALAQRLGQLSESDYYKYLWQLSEKHEINLSEYPQFEAYSRYVSLANSIPNEAFHGDMWDGIRVGYAKKIETAEERSLVEEATRVRLIARVLNFCQSRSGATRSNETSAVRSDWLEALAKELNLTPEEPPRSLWQRLIGFWRRLFSQRPNP